MEFLHLFLRCHFVEKPQCCHEMLAFFSGYPSRVQRQTLTDSAIIMVMMNMWDHWKAIVNKQKKHHCIHTTLSGKCPAPNTPQNVHIICKNNTTVCSLRIWLIRNIHLQHYKWDLNRVQTLKQCFFNLLKPERWTAPQATISIPLYINQNLVSLYKYIDKELVGIIKLMMSLTIIYYVIQYCV